MVRAKNSFMSQVFTEKFDFPIRTLHTEKSYIIIMGMEDEEKEEHRSISPYRKKWLHQCPFLKNCRISETGPKDQYC